MNSPPIMAVLHVYDDLTATSFSLHNIKHDITTLPIIHADPSVTSSPLADSIIFISSPPTI